MTASRTCAHGCCDVTHLSRVELDIADLDDLGHELRGRQHRSGFRWTGALSTTKGSTYFGIRLGVPDHRHLGVAVRYSLGMLKWVCGDEWIDMSL